MADALFAEQPVAAAPPLSPPAAPVADADPVVDEPPPPSTLAAIATPPDPNSLPIHPPQGTPPPPQGELLPEVEMAEAHGVDDDERMDGVSSQPFPSSTPPTDPVIDALPNGFHAATNGVDHAGDTPMHVDDDMDASVPPSEGSLPTADVDFSAKLQPSPPVYSMPNGSAGSIRPHPDDDDDADAEPPAKRARKSSDPDVASLNHLNGAAEPSPATTLTDEQKPFGDASTPAPESAVPVPAPIPVPASTDTSPASSLTTHQHRFILSTVRALKKVKDAAPFLHPVDPIALNILHYPAIVKNPMDLGTVERKVVASNPLRPDANAASRYRSAAEFVADVRLIFANAALFNGPDHAVTQMGQRVEAVFDKQVKNLPSTEDRDPLPAPPAPIPPKKRKSSTAVAPLAAPPAPPAHRLTDLSSAVHHRPKREVHPPAPRDVGYSDLPKRRRKSGKDDGTAEQLKYCSKILSELFKKSHWGFASPFYEPVDWQKLDIPSYPKIIKKPMDLSTMRRKLDRGEYPDATRFAQDFKLMIRNCFTFNPAGTPVNNAGHQLSDLFEEKFKYLPPLHPVGSDDEGFEEEDETDDDQDVAIESLTQQLENVKSNIAALQTEKKKRKEEKRRQKAARSANAIPKASSSRSVHGNKKKGKAKANEVDEVLTFEQKRELSETIGTLEGAKLERVIQIIYEGVPEIRDSQEQIELDIDTLPSHILIKLFNTVMRPIKPKPGPRAGAGRNGATGTGGLKRKSMDEEQEEERIRLLEERILLFDQPKNGEGAANGNGGVSSDSSDSDSSGSDSD